MFSETVEKHTLEAFTEIRKKKNTDKPRKEAHMACLLNKRNLAFRDH